MNKILFASLTFSALFATQSMAIELEVDKAHSSVGFDIKHLMLSSVHGNFGDFNGTIILDEKKFENSKVTLTVNASSINTNDAKRDGHLKSPDFFDVAQFPEAHFKSTSIKSAGSKNKYTLEGDFTIHGKTQKAKFEMTFLGKNKDPFSNTEKYVFHAATKIVRKDYGLNFNKALETGGVLIGDTADLTIDLESAPKKVETKQEAAK